MDNGREHATAFANYSDPLHTRQNITNIVKLISTRYFTGHFTGLVCPVKYRVVIRF